MAEGYVLAAGEGDGRWYAGHRFDLKADAAQTGGTFSLIEITMRRGLEPPLHVHSREEEAFYVLEGEVEFELDGERTLAGPGAFVNIPRGVTHRFAAHTEVSRMLSIFAPGGAEEIFRDFSVPAREPGLPPADEPLPDFEALGRRMAADGIDIVGPPLAPDAQRSAAG
jgi:quercetin dioxygenase-like cupin family protein